MEVPEDWPEDVTSETLLVYISHGTDSKIYQIQISIVFDDTKIQRNQGSGIKPKG